MATTDATLCEERIRALWRRGCTGGDAAEEMRRPAGVIHVTAVGRTDDGHREVIAIGSGSPPSRTDFFLLNLCRARAEAIVTTGRILRSEPDVHHGPQGSEDEPALLAAFRRERLGLDRPPRSVVLTSGRDVDLAHPMFHGARPALVVTGTAGAAALRARSTEADVEVVELPRPDLRAVLAWLAREGCATVCVEAGPATSLDLYRPPVAVDELVLSTWEERVLPRDLRAGRFPSEAEIERLLPRAGPVAERSEESGRWSFRRRRRT
ncbi:dihydrofolate reductase family protein [bacterium]|nr:dihydrofolate reductase family protein [bacterium]